MTFYVNSFSIMCDYKKALIMNLCVAKAISSIDAFGGATTLLKCRNIIPLVLRICRTVRTTNATNWSAAFRTYVRKTAPSNVSRMYCFVDRISAIKPAVLKYHIEDHFHRIEKNKWPNRLKHLWNVFIKKENISF